MTKNIPQRRNFDNAINKHGKWLLELCRSLDLRILNGRVKGDSFGQPTSHNRMGISAVDYAIIDQDMFKYVKSFIVKPPTCLSDHS